MLLFWLLAALISAGAAFLMMVRAARAEHPAGPADPEMEVYRRQLGEIDELAERGLLGEEERKAAHAEAGRRLLGHAGRRKAGAEAAPAGTGRTWVLIAAIAAPLLALGGYLVLGSPGDPDQPYQDRLKGWMQASRTDPRQLSVAQMRAVLEVIAAQRPKDPEALVFLAQTEAADGDPATAIRHLRTAAQLGPNNVQTWTMLGARLTDQAGGDVGDEALAAFRRALALDPSAIEPRYFVGRAEIAGGQVPAGIADWQAVAQTFPPDDARRVALEGQIAEVARTGRLPAVKPSPAGPSAPAGSANQAAFIQSMVDGLAARLKAQPNDPAGWARLIRAYGVLGETAKREAATEEAQRLFKDRPADLKTALGGAP